MKTFAEVIQENRAWYCLDCGKCSSVCPVTLHLVDGYSSPRLLVELGQSAGEETVLEDPLLFSCLTCRRCSELCPSEVEFPAFIQQSRQIAASQGGFGSCTHSGTIQTWMGMMADPGIQQNRLDWITADLKTDPESDTIYFPGCLPYFDAVFSDLGIEGLAIARSAVRILNAVGIEPQLLADERCCGHDLYWQGNMEAFQELAELNLEAISRSGAKRIITTCPECAYTLRTTYRQEVEDPGVEVFHLTEYLSRTGFSDGLGGRPDGTGGTATYQDPCRLGRYAGIYQEPRDLLAGTGTVLIEMEHTREKGICCGTSCWTSCGQTNKRIQVERLLEARKTGAQMLVTACPKCQIHLKCAQGGPNRVEGIDIPIRDLTTILAESI
jgi:heterodisulfide reductase subunit D